MKNALVWAMIAAAAALTVPALGGGVRTPAANTRNSVANRTRNVLPSMPIGSGSGQIIELTDSYSILDTTSIFQADRNRRTGTTLQNGNGGPPPPPPPPRVSPVYRAAMFDDVGPVALMEVPDARGQMTVAYLREGETFSWDGSKVQEISPDKLRLVRPASAGTATWIDVAIGRDLNGQQVGALPVTPGYVSQDMAGPARNTGTGTTRLGRGRGGTGGTPGGILGNGLSAGPGTAGPGGALAGSPLDPPLPPGSADAIAARMVQRRQNQLGALTDPSSMPATSGVR